MFKNVKQINDIGDIFMGRQWQIGDPVDYTTDGWMDAQNWGHESDDNDGESRENWVGFTRFKSRRVWKKGLGFAYGFQGGRSTSLHQHGTGFK